MQLQDYDTTTRFQATVVSSERITPPDAPDEIREIVLEVDQPGFQLTVGQNIGILAPGDEEFGKEYHFRLYSLAGTPEHDGGSLRFPICVKRCSYIDEIQWRKIPGHRFQLIVRSTRRRHADPHRSVRACI